MNQAYRSFAGTGQDERVVMLVLVTPADSALDLVRTAVFDVLSSSDLHGLSELLLVEFLLRHLKRVAPEVLDSEPDSSDLDSVKLLNVVVVLPLFILERPGDEPKAVD